MYPVVDPAAKPIQTGFIGGNAFMEFSTLVREKRQKLGLSQKEFSDLLGLNESGERTVRGWELGEHSPAPSRQAQIASLP